MDFDDLPPLPEKKPRLPKTKTSGGKKKAKIKVSPEYVEKRKALRDKKIEEEKARVQLLVESIDSSLKERGYNPQHMARLGAVDKDVLEHSSNKGVDKLRDKNVIWKPFPGVQTHFLQSDEDEILFSGGRGSGKSMCLIVDPLRYVHNKNFRALIIRRTMPELKELIGRAKDIYNQAFPGIKWKDQDKTFTFPSGAAIEFGYCDHIDDVERYRGQQYTWLGIDELSQFESEEFFQKLKGSLRTTDPTLKIYFRATTNPTGKGRNWVKKYFIDGNPPGVRFYSTPATAEFGGIDLSKHKISKKWFQSTVADNPAILENNPHYVAQLASLPEVLRKQWLDGSWDAIEGMAFPEFDEKIHVCQPFAVPKNWLRFRGCDWGYSSEAVCLWMAVDYDNNIYVYRELVANGKYAQERSQMRLTADRFGQKVVQLETEAMEHVKYGVLDVSTWAKRGDSGPSIAEEMEMQGCFWRQSDRTPGSRKAAKNKMHKLLEIDEFTQKPRIFIFSTCKELIRCLTSLPVDDNDPEDVDTDAYDHPWDALMYGIMSRPHIANNWDFDSVNYNRKPLIINSTFGY